MITVVVEVAGLTREPPVTLSSARVPEVQPSTFARTTTTTSDDENETSVIAAVDSKPETVSMTTTPLSSSTVGASVRCPESPSPPAKGNQWLIHLAVSDKGPAAGDVAVYS